MRINKSIIQKAIDFFGSQNQITKVIEELGELIVAISKDVLKHHNDKSDVITEIADVYIMIEQLKTIYDISEMSIQDEIDFKLTRLKKRIEEGIK